MDRMNPEYNELDVLGPEYIPYDGAEYDYDEFGERIAGDDMIDEFINEEDAMAEEEMAPATSIENGFGETIRPDANPHIEDQLGDPQLSQEAEADYPDSRTI